MTDPVQQPPVCKCGHAKDKHGTVTGWCMVPVGKLEACQCYAYRPVQQPPPPVAALPLERQPRDGQRVVCPECGVSVALVITSGGQWLIRKHGFTRTRVEGIFNKDSKPCRGTRTQVWPPRDSRPVAPVQPPPPTMGMDTRWPLHDVLARLMEAGKHLLGTHNCDHHGYETLSAALDAARDYHAALLVPPPLFAPPPAPVPWNELRLLVEWTDNHLDTEVAEKYREQPLAQDWARVAKASEEAGEAIDALIGISGQNPRKGVYGSTDKLLDELADVALTGLYAIQHFTKDGRITMSTLIERARYHRARIEGTAND